MRKRFRSPLGENGDNTVITVLPLWMYFLAITTAELLTVFLQPVVGVICHGIILVGLLVQSVFAPRDEQRNLIVALSMVPLVRIMSLSMPLSILPQIFWYPIIYFPLLVATVIIIRFVDLNRVDVGLVTRGLPLQILIGLVTGFIFGVSEYFILRPEPFIAEFSFRHVIVPFIVLTLTTGFVEELMFRGVLQRLAEPVMGTWGIIFVSLIFAVLHVGFYSVIDVAFVFVVALAYGLIVKKTGSLVGVTLSHGIANGILFLIGPFILG